MDISQNDYQDLLQDGILSAKVLLKTLEEEYHALENDDLDAFIKILEHKYQTLSELQNIDAPLVELKTNRQAEPGKDTVLWNEFSSLMEQCRQKNAINGRIIHMRQNQTNAALAILRGQSHVEEMNYGPRGKSTAAPTSTHIASA